jgi:hypothetical protein
MLSTRELKSLHRAFLSRNGALNREEFMEVGRRAAPFFRARLAFPLPAFGALRTTLTLTPRPQVMQAHLPEKVWKDRALFLHNIHDLYAQLDVNEDGFVEWSEMFDRQGVTESGAAHSAGKAILP